MSFHLFIHPYSGYTSSPYQTGFLHKKCPLEICAVTEEWIISLRRQLALACTQSFLSLWAMIPDVGPGLPRTSPTNVSFFFFFKILFIYSWKTQREKEREAETQAEGEAGSMQGAQRGTRSQDSRIMPWTEDRRQTAEPPRDSPPTSHLELSLGIIQFISLGQHNWEQSCPCNGKFAQYWETQIKSHCFE